MNFAFIRHTRTCFLCLAVSLFSFVVVTFAGRGRKQSPPIASRPVTFSQDIAPIVFRSCAPCHHSGEAGPFPLVTYGDVKSHARQIADVTNRRLMPPWLPSLDGLQFEEDSHLSGEQIALFEKSSRTEIQFWMATRQARSGVESGGTVFNPRERERCVLEFYFSFAGKFVPVRESD